LPADHRRRFLLAFCVCVAMGALGGVLAATLGDVDPDPAVARFTPPAESRTTSTSPTRTGASARCATPAGKSSC